MSAANCPSLFRGHRWCCLLVWVVLLSSCSPKPPTPMSVSEAEQFTGVTGAVVDSSGKPAAGAWIYAYRSNQKGLRGPADFAARVDADGRYQLDLLQGRYWLVARLRQAGHGDSGPPRSGDAWAPYQHNPVTLAEGESSVADFILQVVAQPTILRQGSLASGDTGFSGTLVDAQGRPVVGAFVLAYGDLDLRRMPEFTSAPVGEDGRFELFIAESGRYCLAARSKTRGQPQAGEPYGLLGPGDAACVESRSGEIRDVGEIVLRPFRQ